MAVPGGECRTGIGCEFVAVAPSVVRPEQPIDPAFARVSGGSDACGTAGVRKSRLDSL